MQSPNLLGSHHCWLPIPPPTGTYLIQWPQIAPQVGASWYITYLLCLWDVETLVLIYPPGGETLALRIFNLLHYGHNAQVNALCLLLLAVALAPLAAWSVWRHFSNLQMLKTNIP